MEKNRTGFKVLLGQLCALCVIAGCAPSPQYCGQLLIMNCTETTLSVQSNLNCPGGDFPNDVLIQSGESVMIASTDNYPESGLVTIDKFFTNFDDASIIVTANLDGIQVTRVWKYTERDNNQKQLFDLSDCSFESGEDFRNNFTYMNYIFIIQDEDFRE